MSDAAIKAALVVPLVEALLSLARSNVPTDVQALLVYGDERAGVAPGALTKAIAAAIEAAAREGEG